MFATVKDMTSEPKPATQPKQASAKLPAMEISSEEACPSPKLRGASIDSLAPDEVTGVVLKVSIDGYTPPGVEPTAWIGPNICTARLSREQIRALEDEPIVTSIEISHPIRAIEPR